jgi:hypothetical protein
MCCDGTLFEKASLKDEADEKLAQSFGLTTFTEANGKHRFKLPCHHFEGCCTVYDQTRPHTCGAFFCTPLQKVQQGQMEWAAAKAQVEGTLQARTEILNTAAQTEVYKTHTIGQLISELHPQPSEQIKQYPALWLKLIGFAALRHQMTQNSKSKLVQS